MNECGKKYSPVSCKGKGGIGLSLSPKKMKAERPLGPGSLCPEFDDCLTHRAPSPHAHPPLFKECGRVQDGAYRQKHVRGVLYVAYGQRKKQTNTHTKEKGRHPLSPQFSPRTTAVDSPAGGARPSTMAAITCRYTSCTSTPTSTDPPAPLAGFAPSAAALAGASPSASPAAAAAPPVDGSGGRFSSSSCP